MRILVVGTTGLSGSRLRASPLQRGHELIGVAHRVPTAAAPGVWAQADIAALTAADWAPLLRGMAGVVNCVGIFREASGQRFDNLHAAAETVLFLVCVKARVTRVVQLSALGADAAAEEAYQRSKHEADEFLLGLQLDAVVAQPSLVFARDGQSARWFLQLAAGAWWPLPDGGRQRVQPLHVNEAVSALVVLIEQTGEAFGGGRVALVGPQPLSLASYLNALRQGLGLLPTRRVSVPAPLMRLSARLGDAWSPSLLDSASWRMLLRGNTASAAAITALIGHAPRPAEHFIEPALAPLLRQQSQLPALLGLLRLSVAVVWLATALVSFGVYPVADSFELLARAGVQPALQPFALYGADGLDLLLGLFSLVLPARHRRGLWLFQAGLILAYTAIITWRLPEFWLHPYGPILKNLPMLTALAVLTQLDRLERKR